MATEETTNRGGWQPEPGDVLEGKVAELNRGWSDFMGDFYPIVVIKKENGDLVNVHCFHAALRNRLLDIQPKPGDRLRIKYEGQREHKRDSNRKVSVYSVEAPDREQDARAYWQGLGASSPNRQRVQQATRQETQMNFDPSDDDFDW